jgi:hypothetical protein
MDPLRARERDIDQRAVLDHPQSEAVVVLVKHDLDALRPVPPQRLQIREDPAAPAASRCSHSRMASALPRFAAARLSRRA